MSSVKSLFDQLNTVKCYNKKLEIAKNILNPTIIIPGKIDRITNWILQIFLKSKHHIHRNLDYWDLLLELLPKIKDVQLASPLTPILLKTLKDDSLDFTLVSKLHIFFQIATEKSLISSDQLSAFSSSLLTLKLPNFADDFCCDVLDYTIQQNLQASSLKKSFLFIVQKTLQPLILLTITKKTTNFDTLFEKLVKSLIFHPDHLLEFTFVLKELESGMDIKTKKDAISYPVHFFTCLEACAKKDNSVIYLFPTIFNLYVAAVKSAQPKDIAIVSFQLLKQLESICLKYDTDNIAAVVIPKLLEVLKQNDIYRPGNDEISKSHTLILRNQQDIFYSWIPKAAINRHIIENILNGVDTILAMDFQVVKEKLHQLWPILLFPHENELTVAKELMINLFSAFVKARDVPFMLLGAFKCLLEHSWFEKPNCILVDIEFLSRWDSSIQSMLASQTMEILSFFENQLIENFGIISERKAKRVKLDSESDHISDEIIDSTIPSSLLIHTSAIKI
ncbi:hypothetical protein BC833DRAFT_103096 [Globomyces pollinis-pini]|nr:hypothetical protein BC833DRAFT_103096 [Globomyces pollinis-pini]